MKTMTCKQMGGPCDTEIHGETAQEMMENGAKHLQEANDEAHKEAQNMMAEVQKDPEAQSKWSEDFAKQFAQLP
jgi:vacuolar-type H+-ATPase subunit H